MTQCGCHRQTIDKSFVILILAINKILEVLTLFSDKRKNLNFAMDLF